MSYALQVGLRYLRSKKRATVSVITVIAVTGVALGVAALLSVMSITSGFQDEFRNKVLGVNAHVLVLKYGLDFEEYREVVASAESMPEVVGAAPFLIHEMMVAKGENLSGVLVKGVDPERMPDVLDLPRHMVAGSLEGLRREGARPMRPKEKSGRESDETVGSARDLDAYLAGLLGDSEDGVDGVGTPPFEALAPSEDAAPQQGTAATQGTAIDRAPAELHPESDSSTISELPRVRVPSPADVEAALGELDLGDLPDDGFEDDLLADQEQAPEPVDTLAGIVIGQTLADTLGAELGDRVKIISPLSGLDTSMWRADGGVPQSRDFRVTGIFQAGFQEYDSRLVYVDMYEAQAFHDQGDTVTGVEIRLHDLEKAPEVSLALERLLGAGAFHTLDWKELNHNLFTALEIQKIMLSLVIATIIFVAAFNVVATLIMIVLEKRREISILKAMGAKDSAILSVFMVQGAVIGLLGTLIGLVLGGGVCAYLTRFQFPLDPKVYLIDHLPVRTSPTEFLATVAISLLICVSATLLPSWWAARLLPVDGIRYQ